MLKRILFTVGLTVYLFAAGTACANEDDLIAFWKFNEGKGKTAIDSVSGSRDSIKGNFRYIKAVSGTGIKCDGFTTRITRKADDSPELAGSFTIQAWIAAQAYPWNWCAIVNQHKDNKAGYFFGIDQLGHVGLHLAVDDKWQKCTSEKSIEFMKNWSHIAGTFSEDKGLKVYIDGRLAASLPVKGQLTLAGDVDLQIAHNHKKTLLDASALVRKNVNFPTSYSFDGIIDELKIYNRALTLQEIAKDYHKGKPKDPPPLKWRKLPKIKAEGDRFGAVYCRLDFYEQWDALWRVAGHPDVAVTFDNSGGKMIFWRGTNYNMNLVTENDIWVGDQSAETGAAAGCAEHMSDKQCRFAHVRIIENTDARVVVHWRYALCDVLYNIAGVDDIMDWGIWADEYYYIYPDAIATRNFFVHGAGGFSVTEPTVLNNPGEKAEDNISLDAVTLANMDGKTRTYSWKSWPANDQGRFKNPIPQANICIVNLKSRFKPCYVYEPRSRITPYGWKPELRPEYSHFPTWNHWPVSQAPSDGRYALVPDRVSSSAVTSPRVPEPRTAPGSDTRTGRFIMGLSDKPIEHLVKLARSWLQAPKLKIDSENFSSKGYSRDQRAYVLQRKTSSRADTLEFELQATEDSPVVNPAFVIKKWDSTDAELKINGTRINRGNKFRFGHRDTLDGSDLVVWLKYESTKPMRFSLQKSG